MTAFMVVQMDLSDMEWTKAYFAEVPPLLADHGGVAIAASRTVKCVEGDVPAPQRMAIFRFPSIAAIERFFADPRYRPYRESRQAGSVSQIFAFENAITGADLV